MEFGKKINFSVDAFEVIVNDPSFMVLEIDIISDGRNRHKTEFMVEDIVRNIPKLSNKPLNCLFSPGNVDFKEHAWTEEELKKQIGIGTVPESNKAKIVEKKGRKFLRLNAIVWKYLFPQAEAILKRRKKVAISMEITPLNGYRSEDGKSTVITDWNYEAITLLGHGVMPAIPDAQALVTKFSSMDNYFQDIMVKYGAIVDSYTIPDKIKENIKFELEKQQSNPEALVEAFNVLNRNTLNYTEIIALKEKILSLSDSGKTLLSDEEFLKWTDAIEKERNGGTEDLEKIKELLTQKFSEDVKYISHNETVVFCFDYETAQFKSFKYTYEKVEEEEKLEVEDEFEVVVKLEDSEEFKSIDSLEEGEAIEDSTMYSISAYQKVKEEYNSCKEKLSKKETEYEELEKDKKEKEDAYSADIKALESDKKVFSAKVTELGEEINSLNEKILSYSVLEEEIIELREYKTSKDMAEKSEKINSLYAKYAEHLTEEEVNALNEKASTIEYDELVKEVYSIVTPKMESALDALIKEKNTSGGSADNLNYNVMNNINTDDDNGKPKSLLQRLKEL